MSFMDKIRFRSEWVDHLGPEREFFLVDPETGLLVPRSEEFLARIKVLDPLRWTKELSGCQAEERPAVPYKNIEEMRAGFLAAKALGEQVAKEMGLALVAIEVAPEDMPLDVHPAYRDQVADMPEWKIRAACRVAGTHFHYGCRDLAHAVRVHNLFVAALSELKEMGDGSNGERLRLYELMAPQIEPPRLYRDVAHFLEHADDQGYAFVRITEFGTVELRVLGNSEDIEVILKWAARVWEIARQADVAAADVDLVA